MNDPTSLSEENQSIPEYDGTAEQYNDAWVFPKTRQKFSMQEDSNKRTFDLLKQVFDASKYFFFNHQEQCMLAQKSTESLKDMVRLINSATEEQLEQLLVVAKGFNAERLILSLINGRLFKDKVSQNFVDKYPMVFNAQDMDSTIDQDLKDFVLGITRPYEKENLIMESVDFIKKSKEEKRLKEKPLKDRLQKEIPWQTMETLLPSLCLTANDLTEQFDTLNIYKIKELLKRLVADCNVVQRSISDVISLIEREQNPTKYQEELLKQFEELKIRVTDQKVLAELTALQDKVNKLF